MIKRLLPILFLASSILADTQSLLPGAKTPIRNGYLENDLDARGHSIINCLNCGGGGSGNPFANIQLTNSSGFQLVIDSTDTVMTASRGLHFKVNDAPRTLSLFGDATVPITGTVAMGAGTLTATSTNSTSGANHTHAITSSANPGAGASILASDANGYLQLVRLGIGTNPTQSLEVAGNAFVNNATANLYLKDTSTGFQSGSTTIVTPQSGNSFRNTSFSSGISGWNINDIGNAEFNDLLVRGTLIATVFKINEISATAGTFGVFYSASSVTSSFTTPANTGLSFTFIADNSSAGGMLFGVSDIVRFKTWTGGGISDAWATITARTNNGTNTTYTATLSNGSTNATYPAGTPAVDYGPSGTGFITESADGTVGSSPNLSMATHAGSPWSTQTLMTRLGNLNGSYGYNTNVYGLGIGSYGVSSQPWQTYDTTNGIRIGNNTTVLSTWDTSGGITIGQVSDSSPNITIDTTNGIQLRLNTTVIGQWDTTGNLTLGTVATNQGNAFWNNSNKRLEFRGGTAGTVVQAYVDTDGSIVSGAGKVKLNSTGLSFTSGSAGTGPHVIDWFDAAGTHIVDQIVATYAVGSNETAQLSSLVPTTDTATVANSSIAAINNTGGAQASFTAVAYGTTSPLFANTSYGVVAGPNFTGLAVGPGPIPTHMLEVTGSGNFTTYVILTNPHTPANSSDTCEKGTVTWDTSYWYVCVATNTWKRTAISTW
jgi:hypothetical protein